MEILVFLAIVLAIFRFICRRMAVQRGRDANWGFLMGFCFGLWAVFGYVIAGDSEEKKWSV